MYPLINLFGKTVTSYAVMVIIGILAVVMNEGYLVDICLIYATISFLAVIVLTKVIQGIYKEEEVKEDK